MAKLQYVTGDATRPQGDGIKVIPHIVNDQGRWGRGFVVALSNRWSEPEQRYRAAKNLRLGEIQPVAVGEDDIVVINMVAQHGTVTKDGRPPIRYLALTKCLELVRFNCHIMHATVHAPRFGSGLAGGEWKAIEALIYEMLVDRGHDVTIYDLP